MEEAVEDCDTSEMESNNVSRCSNANCHVSVQIKIRQAQYRAAMEPTKYKQFVEKQFP